MRENNNPLISIIILNYNQLEVSVEFLESAKKLSYKNYEIIFVDNASKENPSNFVATNFPDVRLIVNETNLGFTGGNNVGIKAGKGDYFFIVNNDTEVTDNLLEKLLEPFQNDSSIGVVSPKIRYFHNPQIIQYAGFTEVNPFTGRNRAIGGKEIDVGQHDKPGYTSYAHGAAMLVKREVVDMVGMLPDEFFIYYEELDWSAHIRRAGYKIYYQPTALIYHKESITMGKESALKAYYHTRNRILFMRRNTSSFQFLCFTFFVIFFIIPKSTIKYVMSNQMTHLKNFFRGLLWNLKSPRYFSTSN
ncbi:MAG: glycosyltransferase family 2 protein [Cyclobacteriaceae bacterium]|nr:glycosyltransferase family 2 protein [Cyclobacteriaceae bacterium]